MAVPRRFWLAAAFLSIALHPSGPAHSQEQRQPLSAADAALQAGRFADAAAQYERWLKAHPQAPDVLLALGVCYLQLGRSSEAASTLERHVKLAPMSAAGHAALGLALLDGFDTVRARRALETAIKLDPQQGDAREALARIAMAEGRHEDAVSVLAPGCDQTDSTCLTRSVASLDDENAVVVAEALMRSGRAAHALAMLQQRITASSAAVTADLYTAATRAAIAAKDLEAAASIAERGMRLYPDSDVAEAYLALPAEFLAQRVAARVNALRENPDLNEMVSLARVLVDADPYRKTRAHELAERMLRDVLQADPRNASARYQYGRFLRLQNDRAGAIREWESALAATQDDELKLLLYSRIGVAKADLGDLAGAEAAQKASFAINQNLQRHRPDAALEYAALLRALERPAEAEAVIRQVLSWSPFFPEAHLERAKLAAAKGQWSRVAEDSEFALRAGSRDTQFLRSARTLLVRAYHNLGQPEKAREHTAWLEANR